MPNSIPLSTIIDIISSIHTRIATDTSIPYRERIACLKTLDILLNAITSLESTPRCPL
jgi:hypothetical protein